jgi:small subunit ribosomal protein S20
MANHKSSIKRIRQTDARRMHNRYFARTTRNAIKVLRETTKKDEASELLPKVTALLDKLAKKKIIHKNKASNLKSSLAIHVNKLQ